MDKILTIKSSDSLKQSIIRALKENNVKATNCQIQNLDPFVVRDSKKTYVYRSNKTIAYKKNNKWQIDELVLAEFGEPKSAKDASLVKDAKVMIFGF